MTTLLLWGSEEKATSGGLNPRRGGGGGNSKEIIELKNSPRVCSSKAAMKKAKINGGAQKKQPQRGLGVAQLERLRLQEQKKRLQEDHTAMAASGNSRLAPLQPYLSSSSYGYGRNVNGYHGQGGFSLMDLRHRHAKQQLSACSSQNRHVFGLHVPISNPRSICEGPAQLAPSYASFVPKYRFCNTELPESQTFVAGTGNNNSFAGMFAGFEDDGRYRGLESSIYPYGRPSHKETTIFDAVEPKFPKSPCNFGQFAETSEIMPTCAPFLQGAAVSKVGVPLTVDQPKELSSFQMFHDNSNYFDAVAGIKNHPWYAMQKRQKHAHNLTSALDLKLSSGQSNVGADNADGVGNLSLLRRSSNFLRKSENNSVFYEDTTKSTMSYLDYAAEKKNNINKANSRKRQRSSEEDHHHVAVSKHSASFLALTLSTSASAPDSLLHSVADTDNNSDETICEIYIDTSQTKIAEENPGTTFHTHIFLPSAAAEKDAEFADDEESPSWLEISSNSVSAGSCRASTDATSSLICHSSSALDLSLKLAI